jgi:GH43 family beta-xylosidase
MRTSSLIWVFSALVAMTSAATFTNPLVAQNGSDPQMTYADGYYYLMTTTWTNLQITRSRTLDGIRNGERKVVWTDEDPNRCCNMWAPELHKIDNRYALLCHSVYHGVLD